MKNIESRRCQRHKLEDTFVVNQEGICQVFDISPTGISFRCTNERNFPESLTVDVVNNSGMHVWDLPIKPIWVEKINADSFSSLYVSRLGAKFEGNLTPEHLSAISNILSDSE
jgi:hypothetical protein